MGFTATDPRAEYAAHLFNACMERTHGNLQPAMRLFTRITRHGASEKLRWSLVLTLTAVFGVYGDALDKTMQLIPER